MSSQKAQLHCVGHCEADGDRGRDKGAGGGFFIGSTATRGFVATGRGRGNGCTSQRVWKSLEEEQAGQEPKQKSEDPEEAKAEDLELAKPSKGQLQVQELIYSVPAELPLPEAIKEMNDKHAVISNLGGKCVVMEWVPSIVMPGTKELAYQSFTSFRERYASQYVDCGHVRASTGNVWLAHPHRRQYEGLDLVPNGPGVLPGRYLNLWRGWGVEATQR
jgi:hypothetical protein